MTVSYRLVVRLSRMAAMAGFLAVFVPCVWIAGPTVEARVAPVLRSDAPGPTIVTGQRVCWPIKQHKLREGEHHEMKWSVNPKTVIVGPIGESHFDI